MIILGAVAAALGVLTCHILVYPLMRRFTPREAPLFMIVFGYLPVLGSTYALTSLEGDGSKIASGAFWTLCTLAIGTAFVGCWKLWSKA
jgi:hypothetical protein